jgi:UDP-N-acetylglucosamine 2-epimerase (non-hydrolysing)
MKHISIVVGTRPEIIKMAPVIRRLKAHGGFAVQVIYSSQHGLNGLDMARSLGVEFDAELSLLPSVDLSQSVAGILEAMSAHLRRGLKPDLVLVQGDTTTALGAAMAAYYARIPVGHVEAGLRSYDLENPFPEEANRKLIAQLASLHFAPTNANCGSLLMEGIRREQIAVTGNTIVDQVEYVSTTATAKSVLTDDDLKKNIITVTLHQRGSWGDLIQNICKGIIEIAKAYPNTLTILPAHFNPTVRAVVTKELSGFKNIRVIDPLNYNDFIGLMKASMFIITDSGGVQEEAAALRRPVLVARKVTERREGIQSGISMMVGSDPELIFKTAEVLLTEKVKYEKLIHVKNKYGDGNAAQRIHQSILHFFEFGEAGIQKFLEFR